MKLPISSSRYMRIFSASQVKLWIHWWRHSCYDVFSYLGPFLPLTVSWYVFINSSPMVQRKSNFSSTFQTASQFILEVNWLLSVCFNGDWEETEYGWQWRTWMFVLERWPGGLNFAVWYQAPHRAIYPTAWCRCLVLQWSFALPCWCWKLRWWWIFNVGKLSSTTS